ncbi:ABC transporter permease [Clostridium sp. CS001]|uniref:ABC transporter permease n=1 Tax=Clostridium sp. CS001 TaxID=2880648 RepID=UPI001CF42884|nr:ABC transporter permease [Clostridium sp. CS001]MCB2291212.1 ABC transporter permease [Clostridium sp. CS001]
MNIFESVKSALSSIRANKMRAFLTMLGIIIGISSVITIVSLGQGGQSTITSEFEKLGSASVTVKVSGSEAQSTDYITLEDVKQIKQKLESIKYASPSYQLQGAVISEKRSKNAFMRGGSPDLAYINNTEILFGRYFNEKEYEQGIAVGIIDESDALTLFGYSDVVGESIKIGQGTLMKKMTIVGVEKGISSPFGNGRNSGKPIIVTAPITFLSTLQSNEFKVSSMTVVATSQENSEAVGNGTIKMLEARHNNRGKEIYSADNALAMLEQINSVLGIFTAFISAVAAISLLVGGIGVMNIMLVSVTERTREIGIRKAVGATTTVIMMQFLIESVILSSIGGIIGMILGIVGAEIIGVFAGIEPIISWTSIIGSILFSSAVGVFFGIYPAKKAAELDPIDALRYE